MSAPISYVAWINSHVGFNPRGQGHSDELTGRVFEDLTKECPGFARQVRAGALELRENVGLNGVRSNRALAEDDADPREIDSNIDGVALGVGTWASASGVTSPLALENKTIMTAHGKARTNRYGDMRAFASHVHGQSPVTIAAFAIIINTALAYKNPDAFARNAKQSGTNKPDDAANTIRLFTQGTILREEVTERLDRCEALLILPIRYDGKTATAKLVTAPPAPPPTSPYCYENFLARICELFEKRFGH